MLYTMMLDETVGLDPAVRSKHRDAIAHELNAPLDPLEREIYEDEHWGMSAEALAEQEQLDELFAMEGEE